MKPPMPRENIEPLIDALHSSGRSGDAALIEAVLTERDEAIREVERLKVEATEDLARHLIQADATIMAEKRRTAAVVEAARDNGISDAGFRMVALSLLDPQKVTAKDIAWAESVLAPSVRVAEGKDA